MFDFDNIYNIIDIFYKIKYLSLSELQKIKTDIETRIITPLPTEILQIFNSLLNKINYRISEITEDIVLIRNIQLDNS